MSYVRTEATYSFGFSNGATSTGGSITVNLNDVSSVFDEGDVDAAVSAYLASLDSKPGVSVTSATKTVVAVESGSF